MHEIVPLSSNHDRSSFDCGVSELNAFLKTTARQHIQKGISRTFVLIDQESPASIMGFFTITLCEVMADKLPAAFERKYPKHPLPALRLARLAVSQQLKGKGYGGLLLAEAVHRTLLVAEQAGLIGLVVDAKDENAYNFYERYGFVPIPDSPLQLFLPLATMLKALPKVD